jgi:fucose 4-O-acetylase-like acetyltransferase
MLAKLLAKHRYAQAFLGKLGAASMVIMFLHQPIQLGLMQFFEITDSTTRFFIATLAPCFIFALINRNGYLRAIFLGSKVDFNRCFQPARAEVRPQP